MIERPILFSAPMVRAMRENRKTQTRRTRGMDKINTEPDGWDLHGEVNQQSGHGKWCFGNSAEPDDDASIVTIRCPYGVAGDRLWTRETFYCDDFRFPNGPIEAMRDALEYRADHDCANWEAGCPCASEGRSFWKPSIHIPRWASRDTLEVVSARPERLQTITDEDARAEGIVGPVHNFITLWDSINGKALPWSKNPWIWRVVFRRLNV